MAKPRAALVVEISKDNAGGSLATLDGRGFIPDAVSVSNAPSRLKKLTAKDHRIGVSGFDERWFVSGDDALAHALLHDKDTRMAFDAIAQLHPECEVNLDKGALTARLPVTDLVVLTRLTRAMQQLGERLRVSPPEVRKRLKERTRRGLPTGERQALQNKLDARSADGVPVYEDMAATERNLEFRRTAIRGIIALESKRAARETLVRVLVRRVAARAHLDAPDVDEILDVLLPLDAHAGVTAVAADLARLSDRVVERLLEHAAEHASFAPVAWAALGNRSRQVRERAMDVLERRGSAQALPHLVPLTRGLFRAADEKQRAAQVMAAIERRVGEHHHGQLSLPGGADDARGALSTPSADATKRKRR